MSETTGRGVTEVIVPDDIDQAWLDEFNEQYANKDFTATVIVEDWLEQPEGEMGSAYFSLDDRMSSDGWWQNISGKVYNAGYTNVPHYEDTGFANVLALTDANLLQHDGTPRPLAEGRLVLVRLDKLKSNPLITNGQK
jgi:hypothetical protein